MARWHTGGRRLAGSVKEKGRKGKGGVAWWAGSACWAGSTKEKGRKGKGGATWWVGSGPDGQWAGEREKKIEINFEFDFQL
jgi:hypothetical protein